MKILKLAHNFYKKLISPLFGNNCRFHPSCSDYAIEAYEKHGLIKGTVLSVWRILRCQPFSRGWFDPVPSGKTNLFNKKIKNIKLNLNSTGKA